MITSTRYLSIWEVCEMQLSRRLFWIGSFVCFFYSGFWQSATLFSMHLRIHSVFPHTIRMLVACIHSHTYTYTSRRVLAFTLTLTLVSLRTENTKKNVSTRQQQEQRRQWRRRRRWRWRWWQLKQQQQHTGVLQVHTTQQNLTHAMCLAGWHHHHHHQSVRIV